MNVRLNLLDRVIGLFAPAPAMRRGMARGAIDAARAYDGAATGRRTSGWKTPTTSADAEIAAALPVLRARSRDLVRNNPHARRASSVWVNNIVGSGIRPRPKSGDASLDARALALWEEWARVADADGQLDIYGLQELMVREMVEGGECVIRRRLRRQDDGLPVPLQLQIMEGEQLDLAKCGMNGPNRIVSGIEFDAIGRRAAYWLFPDHPGSAFTGSPLQNVTVSRPVPSSEIVHLYRRERTELRGVPWGSAVIRGTRDLDDYEAAEIVRKKTEACVVAIVLGAESGDEAIAPDVGADGMAVRDASGRPIERFEPGLIAYAHGGKDIKFNNPQANGGFVDYKKASLHTIAAGYLIPYELLSGDLSEVNFSSARVGLVEFRRLVDVIQWLTVAPVALDRIWTWFCESAYWVGALPQRSIPVEWAMPRFDSVNPIDDANAELILIRSGLKTLRQAIAERGYDPDAILREHAETAALLDKLGLVFDSDPRRVSRGGQEQPSQQAQEAQPPKRLRPVA